MPQIIEEPDLIRCEHAKRKNWPSTFRLGSYICVNCNRVRCEFHPPRAKPVICRPQEQPEALQTPVVTRVEPAFKPKTQINPKDLTPKQVLENFPSPTLRPYQKEILVRIAEEFQAGKKCIILAAPTGFGKCLLPEERVFAKNGLIQMKELLSDDDPNFRTNAFPIGQSQVMRITTRHGYSLRGGNRHGIVVFDGEFKWKQLCELKVGDCVPITYQRVEGEVTPLEPLPRRYSHTGSIPVQISLSTSLEEPFAELLGFYLADGCVTSVGVHISSTKKGVRRDISRIADRYGISVSFYPKDVVLNSIHIAKLFQRLLGKGAYAKRVPDQIFRAKEGVRVAFLRGYFKGDGYYNRAINVSEFYTVSYDIAQSVQLLLLSLGIFSTLARKKGRYKGRRHLSWRVTVSGSQNAKLVKELLGIRIATNSSSSWERIPLISGKINSVLKEYVRRKRIAYRSNAYRKLKTMEGYAHKREEPTGRTLLTYLSRMKLAADMPEYQDLVYVAMANCLFDYVKRVENEGKASVYEISCKNGTYVAQGFISHNSYVNAAFTSVSRSFYATPQLALIDQIMRDPYVKSRFVEIRGRRNYQCFLQPDRRVHVGKCITEDYPCKERFDVCPYWKRKMAAVNAPSVLTSLAYLISEGQTEGSESYLGTRTLLVLDEAHNLEEQCLNHVSVRVNPFSIPHEVFNQVLPELLETHTDADVRSLLESIEARLSMMLGRCEKIAQTTGLSTMQAEDLERIRHYLANYQLYKKSKSEWVWQVKNDELLVQPVFGKEFMRDLVWKRGEYYIVSSATILDPQEFAESTGLLNFLKADEISFLTVPSTFPVENRPIIEATVGPLSTQYLATNMPKAIRAVEEILRKEKGNVAIHCHSYQHQRNLVEGLSEDLKPRLIVHTSRDREERLNEWMRSRGKVFVSVAFNEGQDWKYSVCDAQILLKVPFPDLGDMRVKRRLEMGNRRWYDNRALLEVIQAYGRAIRAEDDKARFYIVDGSFTKLIHNSWNITPNWFKEALPASLRRSRLEIDLRHTQTSMPPNEQT